MSNKVLTLVRAADENDEFREWFASQTEEDQKGIFKLSDEEYGIVILALRMNTLHDVPDHPGMYSMPTEHAEEVLSNIKESLHQGLDGWSEWEQVIIRAYLNDLSCATICSVNWKANHPEWDD